MRPWRWSRLTPSVLWAGAGLAVIVAWWALCMFALDLWLGWPTAGIVYVVGLVLGAGGLWWWTVGRPVK